MSDTYKPANKRLGPALAMLGRYLAPFKRHVMLLFALLAINISLTLLAPQAIRAFLDQVQRGAAQEVILTTAVFFFVAVTAQKGVRILTVYVGENLGWTAINNLRLDLAEHCLRLDMGFHKTHTPGELIERIDGDVNMLAKYFAEVIIEIVGNIILALGIILLLAREDWRAGLVGLTYALLVVIFLRAIQEHVVRFWHDVRQSFAEMYGFLEERLGDGLEDVRANGGEAYVMARLYPLMNKVIDARVKAQTIGNVTFVIGYMLYVLGLVAILAIGALSFQQGAMSIGTVFLLTYYMGILETPLNTIRREIDELQRAYASISRINELLALQPQVKQRPFSKPIPATAPTVTFSHVSFSYQDTPPTSNGNSHQAEPLLKDISFTLPAGHVLGLLGRTGSGKTTLTRLLFRLYDVDSGTIRLDDHDIRDVALTQLRRRVSIVTQEVQLFAATVRDNLTLFQNHNPTTTPIADTQIIDAIDRLGLGDWFRSLPDGLDTQLEAGNSGLSAGEGQLFAFTRVFLRDPQLIILDEASARLDPATEQRLEQAIDHLLADRTGIIIAHRLRTVQRADDILVLENGRIREYGPRILLANDHQSRFYQLLQTGLEEVLI